MIFFKTLLGCDRPSLFKVITVWYENEFRFAMRVFGNWYCVVKGDPKREELPQEPVSTLDEIIHDSQWYSPKKKNGNKDKKHAAE